MGGHVYVVAGLGFGDEGKGSTVDYLVRRLGATTVVRYNGGPQAAHHVVEPGGRWHCFSQFGSGTFTPGVGTCLSRHMLVEPHNLMVEDEVLRGKGIADAARRLTLDAGCTVVAPYHKMIGQMLEIARGPNRHGSVGMGVGQAVADPDVLLLGDLLQPLRLRRKLEKLCADKLRTAQQILAENWSPQLEAAYHRLLPRVQVDHLLRLYRAFTDQYGACIADDDTSLRDALYAGETVVLEGAQGALLDRDHGFRPYVTKTSTLFGAADRLLPHAESAVRVGVARAYGHRHGNGPFVTEDAALTPHLAERHNQDNPWQGAFRTGWLDLPALRHGIAINGRLDCLVLTNLDRLSGLPTIQVCTSYEYVGSDTDSLSRHFEWEKMGDGRVRIKSTLVVAEVSRDSGQRARLLFDCRPLDVVEMPGWREDISNARSWLELPRSARRYLEFLQSPAGLGRDIDVVSVGPAWCHKIMLTPTLDERLLCPRSYSSTSV